MRVNKFIASATGMSRRAVDAAIAAGQVRINDGVAELGQDVTEIDIVSINGTMLDSQLAFSPAVHTILLNKPAGYVVSRNGQGSKTVYDLLPEQYHTLKPIGRLDKDSSGLLLLTNNGTLTHDLTHPSKQKIKVYEITLNKPLQPLHKQMISEYGVSLEDGPSKLQVDRLHDDDDRAWRVTMHEGRNRQIRRTFQSLGYEVTKLHRVQFGTYHITGVKPGSFIEV